VSVGAGGKGVFVGTGALVGSGVFVGFGVGVGGGANSEPQPLALTKISAAVKTTSSL
jgi:tetrahydrodipicolinate N-succinyltransferase